MKLVILESPYQGRGETEGEIWARTELNVEYARRCVRDCLLRGEAPIASHLLYTQKGILRDDVAEERAQGIAAGLAWLPVSNYSVFYTDRGWSTGMLGALHEHNLRRNYPFKIRALDNEPTIPATLDEDLEKLLRHYIDRTKP